MNERTNKGTSRVIRATTGSAEDIPLLKKALSRLNASAYAQFAFEMCGRGDRNEEADWIAQAGPGVFYQALLDSYGGSLHSVFVVHYLPTELFSNPAAFSCDDSDLENRVRHVQTIYKSQVGYFGMVDPYLKRARKLRSLGFLTNVTGYSKRTYNERFIPAYERLARRCGLRVPLVVGSPDSFIDLNQDSTRNAFFRFVGRDYDGIRISFGPDGSSVDRFSAEAPLAAVGTGCIANPIEPVFQQTLGHKPSMVAEFESLLQPSVSEAYLEKFIKAHFVDIFGPQYDRIETQLWLRCPELDFGGRDRRLDIFLRNSVVGDWELLELKQPIRLTKSFRDIPVLRAEVMQSIQQAAYYAKLLKQDGVRRKFATMGIDYFEPSVGLVIGRKPQLPQDQWRWLITQKNNDVNLLTYDQLLGQLRCRLEERQNLFCKLVSTSPQPKPL